MRRLLLAFVTIACAWAALAHAQARKAPATPPAPFKTTLTLEQMARKQAVVETSRGTFVIALMPEVAPNHVGYFMKLAQDGGYTGTTFHRAVRMGIIQAGDPLSKDPGKSSQVGTGGFGVLKAEFSQTPMSAGAVAAVLQPGRPDSGGAQFFIAVSDQLALNGQYTVYGKVVEGLEVVRTISEAPVDAQGKVTARIEITKVTIRDAPPAEAIPFSTESIEELSKYRAVLETSRGDITISLRPDKAPEHVRNFLRLATAGVYDGTSFHRVVHGFVVQTGMVSSRSTPLTQKQQAFVHNLQPEFNDLLHVAGTVSMARLDDPASASTSFFICTGPAPSLDGKYSAFGTVLSGADVVSAIDQVAVDGDSPRERIELRHVRIEKP
jgi:cyclophilin family peptidyl-prolyl cis-trans isomerase